MLPHLQNVDMKNAETASARVYVGKMATDTEEEDLYEGLKVFGTIVGIMHNRRFGFIQYESEASAQEAIKNSMKVQVKGHFVIIRPIIGGNKKQSNMERDNVPEMDEYPHPEDVGGHPTGDDMHPWSADRGRGRRGRGGRGHSFQGRPPHTGFRDRSPLNRDWQDQSYDRFGPIEVYRPPERNDCEIIVVSKMLTEYAEFIEDRLKRIGLTVDLLFPNEDVPIGRVLGNISSRGCLYAILVMPQNEEHRSITLNILHGLPQEHRNMPLEDAITLMGRNYAEYQRNGSSAGRDTVLALVRELADGRSLTVLQYDTVLQYVKECREKQVKVELGDAAINNTSAKTQVDLQQRIMSILNSGKKSNEGPSSSFDTQVFKMQDSNFKSDNLVSEEQIDLKQRISSMLNSNSSSSVSSAGLSKTAPPILSNPSVQRALDSLLNKNKSM